MRSYISFVVRCWMFSDSEKEESVVDVEHIQSGEHFRVADLTAAKLQMTDACESARARQAISEASAKNGEA